MTDRATVLSTTEARQASPRRLNLRVLVGSLALCVVVAAALYFVIFAYPQGPIGIPQQQPAATTPATP